MFEPKDGNMPNIDPLKAAFEASQTPAPRADLADEIMAQTQTRPAANDNRPYRRWAMMSGIAAMLIAAVFVLQTPAPVDDAWSEAAENAGFGDLYAWVEG